MNHEHLKSLLAKHGVTQTQLAKWLGRDKSVVTNLLQGRRLLKAHEAALIARELNIEINEIFGGEAPSSGVSEHEGWIAFQHAPKTPNAPHILQRGGKFYVEDGTIRHPKAYALQVRDNSLDLLGILEGDIVISQMDLPVQIGKIAVIQHYVGAGAQTLLRKFTGTVLTAHSSDKNHQDFAADDPAIRIVSPVLKLLRGM